MARRTPNWQPDPGLLSGQVALVAGGAGGIGAATTRLLAAAGAAVAIVDNEQGLAETLAKDIKAARGTAQAVVADLREERACGAAIDEAVSLFGGIDMVANVAGGMARWAPWRHVREWTTENWDAIFDVNLRYVFWVCRAAIPALEARGGGAIVNVASLNGVTGNPNQAAYGAAKAGIINLTMTLADECGPLGIRVNAVSPGTTLTDAAAKAVPKDSQERMTVATPLRQLGRPEDIGRAILFFVSPMAEHVTGQMLLVDGGVSVVYPYFVPGTDHF